MVIIIIAVLLTLGMWSIKGARNTGSHAAALAAAGEYATAVEAFALDHRGRPPRPPGSPDWPSATAEAGPISPILSQQSPYMRAVPEAIQGGEVQFGVTTGRATINYESTATTYQITVRVEGREPCVIGTGLPPDVQACTNRGRRAP